MRAQIPQTTRRRSFFYQEVEDSLLCITESYKTFVLSQWEKERREAERLSGTQYNQQQQLATLQLNYAS